VISILSKPADQIGHADIQELIDSQVPEGDQIEFKERLPTDDGSPDRWVTHGDRIGRRAKHTILEESVAFANAFSGALVLGIAESSTSPPVAERIRPIPRCEDLAERLKLVFRDGVEPLIPSLKIIAVPTYGVSGVVIVRVGKSRMAPHRVTSTRNCTIRRSDRCERMSMREIQDLTLNLSRGIERLERRLRTRSEEFGQEFKCLEAPEAAYGIRVTAMPVGGEVRFDRVYREHSICENLFEPWHSISAKNGRYERSYSFPSLGGSWQPMLRSARNEHYLGATGASLQIYREVHCDGLVECGLVSCHVLNDGMPSLPRVYSGWPIVLFANLLVWADRVRNEASAPTAEYAVDVEFYIRGDGVVIGGHAQGSHLVSGDLADSELGSVRYPGELLSAPRYSLSDQSNINDLITMFDRDFWNSFGQDVGLEERRFLIHGWDGNY